MAVCTPPDAHTSKRLGCPTVSLDLSQISEQSAERIRALEIHHAVAEKPKPVSSMRGHPISHATNRGFKRRCADEDA